MKSNDRGSESQYALLDRVEIDEQQLPGFGMVKSADENNFGNEGSIEKESKLSLSPSPVSSPRVLSSD